VTGIPKIRCLFQKVFDFGNGSALRFDIADFKPHLRPIARLSPAAKYSRRRCDDWRAERNPTQSFRNGWIACSLVAIAA
jgi:hypothetical protein